MLQLGRAFDFSEIAWELVPDSGVFSGERVHFAALVFAVAGYVVGLLLGESGLVSVLVACLYVVVNMVWSVFTGCAAYAEREKKKKKKKKREFKSTLNRG